jgi:Raf kinase inhibitor-like YbhB/YbcL family protein
MKPSGFLRAALLLFPLLFAGSCGAPPAPEEQAIPVLPATSTPVPATNTIRPPAATTAPTATEPGPFTLTSPAFNDGQEMAAKNVYKMAGQCSGENYSPALAWTGTPAGTQSFALTLVDPDGGNWVHWLQFNLPAETTHLPEAVEGPALGVKGRNDFGGTGYGGPCPPGGTHHYVFTLYALDTTLDLKTGAWLKDFQTAIQGHILAEAKLTGLRTAQ